jgi:histidine triad (HIT) family protein
VKRKFLSFLLKIGRLQLARPIVSYFFNHVNHLLPSEPLAENDNWFAIHHPQPHYPLHILILPKVALRSLMESPSGEGAFYQNLFALVKVLIEKYHLEPSGYRLITNGGPNQTIPQWHWHLISDHVCTEPT